MGAIRDFIDDRQKRRHSVQPRSATVQVAERQLVFAKPLAAAIHSMYQDAKLQGVSSHSGRRTFATILIEKGVDIKAVSILMGHLDTGNRVQ
jgi:integrase/recombinase XerD